MGKKKYPKDLHGIVYIPEAGNQGWRTKWMRGMQLVSAYESGAEIAKLWICGDVVYHKDPDNLLAAYKAWVKENISTTWESVARILVEQPTEYLTPKERQESWEFKVKNMATQYIVESASLALKHEKGYYEEYDPRWPLAGINPKEWKDASKLADRLMEGIMVMSNKYGMTFEVIDPSINRIFEIYSGCGDIAKD